MYWRALISLALVFFLLTVVGGCTFFAGQTRVRGAVLEKWETENRGIKIRVTSYEETGANVNGAYYQFESAPSGSNDWREIITFRDDEQPKIPSDQVRFVNDRIGYIFMGWVYAVTTDGGASWSVWDATHDLPNWQCCNYKLIQDVMITEQGNGVMRLNPIENRRGEVPKLRTNDYGKHWQTP